MGTAFNPQADGKPGRMNRVFISFAAPDQLDWDGTLTLVEFT